MMYPLVQDLAVDKIPVAVTCRVQGPSEHPRRRAWWIGLPTVYTVLGNEVWPQFVDWYLAKNGVSGQLTSTDATLEDPVNLWEPADGPSGRDFGAEGRFSDRQWSWDAQIWASRYHGPFAAVGGAGALAGALALVKRLQR